MQYVLLVMINFNSVTTIAGPIGMDEEELGEELDDNSDDEEEYETIDDDDCSEECRNSQDCCSENDEIDETNEATDESSDEDFVVAHTLPSTLKNVSIITPSKNKSQTSFITPVKNSSLRDKPIFSPKLSSSMNGSLLKSRLEETVGSNLTCHSCGTDTDYSVDMGVLDRDDKFECDDCVLAVHPDCEVECQLCRDVAKKVEHRWSLRKCFHESSMMTPNNEESP